MGGEGKGVGDSGLDVRILPIRWAERSARFQEREVGSIEDNFLILLGNERSLIILGLLFLDQETFQRRPLRRTSQYDSHRGPASWFVRSSGSRQVRDLGSASRNSSSRSGP